MNPKTLALRATVAKAMKDHLKEIDSETRADLTDTLVDLLETIGSDRLTTPYSIITLVGGAPSPTVVDESAFLEYVREVAPAAITRSKEVVDAAYWTNFKKGLVNAAGIALTQDGEVIPGVEFRTGTPYPKVTWKKGGKEAVYSAIRGGELSAFDVPALPEKE